MSPRFHAGLLDTRPCVPGLPVPGGSGHERLPGRLFMTSDLVVARCGFCPGRPAARRAWRAPAACGRVGALVLWIGFAVPSASRRLPCLRHCAVWLVGCLRGSARPQAMPICLRDTGQRAAPGPLFTFAAYRCALAKGPLPGRMGGLAFPGDDLRARVVAVCGLCLFGPRGASASPVRSAMAGVNAGVVCILRALRCGPVWTSTIRRRAGFWPERVGRHDPTSRAGRRWRPPSPAAS